MSFKHAILATLFVSTGSMASALTDTRPCRSLDNNSCWHTINQSQKAADLHCKLPYNAYFSANNIEPGSLLSKQFTRAWGDGLGFPEPGKPVFALCSLKKQAVRLALTPLAGEVGLRFISLGIRSWKFTKKMAGLTGHGSSEATTRSHSIFNQIPGNKHCLMTLARRQA